MTKTLKLSFIILLVATLTIPEPVMAREVPSSGAMIMDLLLARPIGLVATVVGAVVFIVATPFTLASGTWKQSGKRLVLWPAKYTFARGLGEFPGYIEEPIEEELELE